MRNSFFEQGYDYTFQVHLEKKNYLHFQKRMINFGFKFEFHLFKEVLCQVWDLVVLEKATCFYDLGLLRIRTANFPLAGPTF